MEYSWNKEFFSHPGTPLRDHHRDVGLACAQYLQEAGVEDRKLIEIAEIIGKTHDFGKYTSFFQRHLIGENVKRGLSAHSFLSSLFSAFTVSQRFSDDFSRSIAYLCVLSHHGDLCSLSRVGERLEPDWFFIQQLKSVERNLHRISGEMDEIGIDGVSRFLDGGEEFKEIIKGSLNRLEYRLIDAPRLIEYFDILMLFSALIDADKKDAAHVVRHPRRSLKSSLVEEYKRKHFGSPTGFVDSLREDIYKNVLGSLEAQLREGRLNRVMTLTAPTGSGKTLTCLAAALRLREHVFEDKGRISRIIYCLPFILSLIHISEPTRPY